MYNSELDISASFEVVAGVTGLDLIKAVEEVTGPGNFHKEMLRANDSGVWYQIGKYPDYTVGKCVVLGDGDLVSESGSYRTITVKFENISGRDGPMFDRHEADFPGAVLKQVRGFRDELEKRLVPRQKKSIKKGTKIQ